MLLSFGLPFLFVPAASAQTSTQQFVYLSLPGSVTNSPSSLISGFSQVSQTGALSSILGSPFSDRFEGGLAAIDGQGKFLFVLNPASNDISMFQVDQTTGALTEVPGSPFAVPPTINPNLAPSQPISIAGEPSGKFLFVGYFAGDLSGDSAVVSLAINTAGASPVLSTIQSVDIPAAPIQLLVDSKGLHLYAGLSQGPNGVATGGAHVFSIDSSTGMLGSLGTADTLPDNGLSYAIDPRDRFFFASGHDFLQSCTISPVDGTANTCSPLLLLDPNDLQEAMVAENSGQFLYVYQSGSSPGVVVYSIDQTTGALTQALGPLSAIQFANGSTVVDPLGPYIYSAQFVTPTLIHAYQVDTQVGNLTEIPGSPFSAGATANCCGGLAISGSPIQAVSGPAVSIFPSTATTFTAVVGATSPTQTFSIVNTGNQLLALNSISITGANASSFSQTNTCQATLAPNANCSVSITFNPSSVGTFTAGLQVTDNAPGSPQTLVLNGTGIAPAPAVTFSPTALSFPNTTQGASSAPQTLTVTSSGNASLHISSVSLAGANPSDFTFTNNCTAPLAPSANCGLSLVFSPLAPGQRTANLLVTDDALGSPQTISISATANPAFSVAAASGSSTTVSVSAGQTANYQLQLTPGSGFTGTVALSCTGAPLGAACQVPANVSFSTGAAMITVTVTTSGPALMHSSAPLRLPPFGMFFLALLSLAFLFLLLLFSGKNCRLFDRPAVGVPWSAAALLPLFLPPPKSLHFTKLARSHFAPLLVSVAAIFSLTLGFAGCGGGSAVVAPPPPPIVTPSGTSTITINLSANSSSGQPLQLPPIQLTLTVK